MTTDDDARQDRRDRRVLDAAAAPIHEQTCREDQHDEPWEQWPCITLAATAIERALVRARVLRVERNTNAAYALTDVRPGDPTPEGVHDGDCPSISDGTDMPYFCTRPADHAGQHIASTGKKVVATWPGERSRRQGERP